MRALLLFLCLPLFAAGVEARQSSVEWDAVTGAAGYRLYSGTAPGDYDNVYDTGPAVSYTITGLDDWRRYYFSVTAYDATTESVFSNELELHPIAASIDNAYQTCEEDGPVMAVPTFVQQKSGPELTSVASQTVTFDSAVASGSMIVVMARSDVSGNTNDTLDGATVSDGTNTYTFRNSQVRGFSGTGYNFAIWTTVAGSSSAFAVTVTPEVTSTTLRVSIIEVGNPLAVVSSQANYSSSPVTTISWDFTNTASADYFFLAGANIQSGATVTPAAGWTSISPGSEMGVIYKTTASTTPDVNDPSFDLSTARRWVGVAISISGDVGATAASMPPLKFNPMRYLGVR